MQAVEFIKKFGWGYSIKFLNYDMSISGGVCNLDFGAEDDLKRYVDAWELVQKHGGLDQSKSLSMSQIGLKKHHNELKQAIDLVEQVNAKN